MPTQPAERRGLGRGPAWRRSRGSVSAGTNRRGADRRAARSRRRRAPRATPGSVDGRVGPARARRGRDRSRRRASRTGTRRRAPGPRTTARLVLDRGRPDREGIGDILAVVDRPPDAEDERLRCDHAEPGRQERSVGVAGGRDSAHRRAPPRPAPTKPRPSTRQRRDTRGRTTLREQEDEACDEDDRRCDADPLVHAASLGRPRRRSGARSRCARRPGTRPSRRRRRTP